MKIRTGAGISIAAAGFVALMFVAWPLAGYLLIVLVVVSVPLLIFAGRRDDRREAEPEASGPGRSGYAGDVTVGEEAYSERSSETRR